MISAKCTDGHFRHTTESEAKHDESKRHDGKVRGLTIHGHPILFTCLRMDCAAVPEGLYISEVRHDDDQQGDSVQIANWIMVNRWGTLITNKPIRLEPSEQINNAYCDMDNGKMKSSAVNLMRVKNRRGKK